MASGRPRHPTQQTVQECVTHFHYLQSHNINFVCLEWSQKALVCLPELL